MWSWIFRDDAKLSLYLVPAPSSIWKLLSDSFSLFLSRNTGVGFNMGPLTMTQLLIFCNVRSFYCLRELQVNNLRSRPPTRSNAWQLLAIDYLCFVFDEDVFGSIVFRKQPKTSFLAFLFRLQFSAIRLLFWHFLLFGTLPGVNEVSQSVGVAKWAVTKSHLSSNSWCWLLFVGVMLDACQDLGVSGRVKFTS